MKNLALCWLSAVLSLGSVACGLAPAPADAASPVVDDETTTIAKDEAHSFLVGELSLLSDSAATLQSFTAAPDSNGWNISDDREAVFTMKQQWKNAGLGYQRVAGTLAVRFPELHASIDQSFEDAVTIEDDANFFDDVGFRGLHAIERTLFSDTAGDAVLSFEQGVGDAFTPSRYVPPSFPTTLTQSEDFKSRLVQRLVDDSAALSASFASADLGLADIMAGVTASLQLQALQVSVDGDGQDHSRYAHNTLDDMRANLDSSVALFAVFDALFEAQSVRGAELKDQIHAAFDSVAAAYDGVAGAALPPVPTTWNAASPLAADLDTDFGTLFVVLSRAIDPQDEASLSSLLHKGASLLELEPQ